MTIVITNRFGEWLRDRLAKKGWSYREMERHSEVSYATIGNIIANPEVQAFPKTIKKIAIALEEDENFLLNMAGYDVPYFNPDMPAPERFLLLFNRFPDNEKEDLLTYMQIKLEMIKKAGKISDSA